MCCHFDLQSLVLPFVSRNEGPLTISNPYEALAVWDWLAPIRQGPQRGDNEDKEPVLEPVRG
jgi:hypothetical protein